MTSVPGSDAAVMPFWSPDGRSVGFFARGRLWRVDLAGGVPRLLATISDPRGGTWGRDNVIVYSPHPDAGLYRVPADGGTPVELTTLDRTKQEISHRWPRFLPDGRHVLFMNRVATANLNRYTITAVPATGGSNKSLLEATSSGVYGDGRLLFLRDEKLFAQRFDPVSVALSGDPELVAEPVWSDGQGMAGLVGFDAAGRVLAWRPALNRRLRLTWKDRGGTTREEFQSAAADEGVPSPDGRLIMLAQRDDQMNTVKYVIFDRARGTITPFTAPDTTSTTPVWSPDSLRVVYSSLRDGAYRSLRQGSHTGRRRLPVAAYGRHESGAELVSGWQGDSVQCHRSEDTSRYMGDRRAIGRDAYGSSLAVKRINAAEGSRPTANGSRTCRTNPGGPSCSSCRSPAARNRYASPRTAAASPTGMRTAVSSISSALTIV